MKNEVIANTQVVESITKLGITKRSAVKTWVFSEAQFLLPWLRNVSQLV